ncbi:hypothetical protein Leryth_024464 [Lithospermum erythrorhizon]|nr:hypothetical protein Leryth_024464 [Lithospermum erythrorhizon]
MMGMLCKLLQLVGLEELVFSVCIKQPSILNS